MSLSSKIIVTIVSLIFIGMAISPYLNEWAKKHIPGEDEEEFMNNM